MDIEYLKTLTDPDKIKEYFQTMFKFVNNGNIVSDDVFNERLNICKECVHYNNNICNICGCALSGNSPFMSKLKIDFMSCPLPEPKWYSVEINQSGINR